MGRAGPARSPQAEQRVEDEGDAEAQQQPDAEQCCIPLQPGLTPSDDRSGTAPPTATMATGTETSSVATTT